MRGRLGFKASVTGYVISTYLLVEANVYYSNCLFIKVELLSTENMYCSALVAFIHEF